MRVSAWSRPAEKLEDRFAGAGWRLAVCTNKFERHSKLLLAELGLGGHGVGLDLGDDGRAEGEHQAAGRRDVGLCLPIAAHVARLCDGRKRLRWHGGWALSVMGNRDGREGCAKELDGCDNGCNHDTGPLES